MKLLYSLDNNPKLVQILICLIFGLHLALTWPGTMSPDSHAQYEMAITHSYRDHHPFLMSLLWHYLDLIYKGPGLMLLFHLSLFYGALFIFSTLFKRKFFILLIPLLPQVWGYAHMIWKDVGFAMSFLLAAAYLSKKTIYKKIKLFPTLLILIILAYGTMVKFQGCYIAPIFLMWIAYLWSEQSFKRFIKPLIIIASIFYSMIFSVQYFGPPVIENHSWQMVKIYDLAAITHYTQKNCFPEFLKTSEFSLDKVNQTFDHHAVDSILWLVKPPILKQGGDNEQERKELWKTWAKEVLSHPFIYLRHRFLNFCYVVFAMPDYPVLIDLFKLTPNKILYNLYKLICFFLASCWLTLCIGFLYLCLGIKKFKQSDYAIPLFFMNAASIVMALVIFFFSMAGTPRYLYISMVLIHASHYFAYKILMDKRKPSERIEPINEVVLKQSSSKCAF